MILVIDNYDSFTYNLVQYLGELEQEVQVIRNDALTVEQIRALQPDAIVISPGPCTPNEAGISLAVVRELSNQIPILGICLGHQTIGQACGAQVAKARQIIHGKTSLIYHNRKGVFCNLPSPFEATRYHSLVVAAEALPAGLEITAWTINAAGERDEIMGLQHRFLPLVGVQFHPESILTQHGHALLQNFLNFAEEKTAGKSIYMSRNFSKIEHNKLRIVPFESRWREHFYRLNAEWLMKYYYIEEFDHQVLLNPEAMILEKGGAIFFALLGEEVIGTCALKQETLGTYELTKMAVTESCQGLGIGRKLLLSAIDEFKHRQGETLFLESHDGLHAALRLYEQLGFVHQPSMRPNSHYQRANVYMIYQP